MVALEPVTLAEDIFFFPLELSFPNFGSNLRTPAMWGQSR